MLVSLKGDAKVIKTPAQKLALGTAQFGMKYGVSNTLGRPCASEVAEIVRYAESRQIDVFDTASLYGDSEEVLSGNLHLHPKVRVVTKVSAAGVESVGETDIQALQQAVLTSLERFHDTGLHAVLLHHIGDLTKPGFGNFLIWLKALATECDFKLGVSVYHPSDIEVAQNIFDVELIQLPLNIFDQRFLQSGLLAQLKSQNIEVHARSVFLQGLLLMDAENLAPHFSSIFERHRYFGSVTAGADLTPLAACVNFVAEIPEIDHIICGVNSVSELKEIDRALMTAARLPDFSEFALADETIINPSLWKLAS